MTSRERIVYKNSMVVAFFIMVAAFLWLANSYGSRVQAAIEDKEIRAIDAEDRAFCGEFGVGFETNRYKECSDALKEIREHHEERNADTLF